MQILRLFLLLALALPAQAANKPKLVVVLVVDQFRSDYLKRFERYFVKDGFKFLMDHGAYFPNAQTNHFYNVTAVGHATVLTGAYPYLHGIIANEWYDDALKKTLTSVQDADQQRSPKKLLTTTVGDELKNATGGKATVVSIALKDRAAILMGGHRPDLVLWVDDQFNPGRVTASEHFEGWSTSPYYGKLPDWTVRWNRSDYLGKRVPKKWPLLLPNEEYSVVGEIPPEVVENANGLGKTFPHDIDGKRAAFISSPWGISFTLDTGLEAVKNMKLGSHSVPDLLAMSLSSFDILGHNYGAYSPEMMDTTLRLDRELAAFFKSLDKLVPGGLANIDFVLTADHGAQGNPGFIEKFKLPGGAYWPEDLRERANKALGGAYVLNINQDNIALDHELLKKEKKDVVEMARRLAEWMQTQPFVAAAYARADILAGHLPPTLVAQKLARSTHSTRSGDLVYGSRPGYVQMPENANPATEHESSTVQDASVPIVFAGPSFKRGIQQQTIFLNDIAPTLASILGIIPPSGSEGRVVSEALK